MHRRDVYARDTGRGMWPSVFTFFTCVPGASFARRVNRITFIFGNALAKHTQVSTVKEERGNIEREREGERLQSQSKVETCSCSVMQEYEEEKNKSVKRMATG